MKSPFVALTIGYGLSLFTFSSLRGMPESAKTKIKIESSGNVGDIVTAIEALKRSDVEVTVGPKIDLRAAGSYFGMGLMTTLGVAMMSGLNIFFYRLYCRWMGLSPTI
jgi:hypothetical protein